MSTLSDNNKIEYYYPDSNEFEELTLGELLSILFSPEGFNSELFSTIHNKILEIIERLSRVVEEL